MSAPFDLILVALAVLGAAAYLTRGVWRREKKAGCSSGCGCATTSKTGLKSTPPR